MRFSPDSVGLQRDAFGYADAAKYEAKKIFNSREYVSAHALYGVAGEGKSSFARMIVESLLKEHSDASVLYTYISLTETNEANGFSRLFSERWNETLQSRYAFFPIASIVPILSVVLREHGMNPWSVMCSALTRINLGIFATKVQCWDDQLGFEPVRVPSQTASLFNHIPEIKEKIWVVVIDEIERSPFDEIYRVIEAIERIRAEGRTGLPVKIVFILVTSKDDLDKSIKCYRRYDPKTFLIEQFFKSTKTVNYALYLPVVSRVTKKKYIVSKIKELVKNNNLDLDGVKLDSILVSGTLRTPDNNVIHKQTDIETVVHILTREPIRVILRCFDEMHQVVNLYYSITQKNITEIVFIGDLLALSFIRIRFPYLIEFFRTTLDHFIISDDREVLLNEAQLTYDLRPRVKNMREWIRDVVGEDIKISTQNTEKQSDSLPEILIRVVASYLNDALSEHGFNYSKRHLYKNRTSDPSKMKFYLNLFSGTFKDNFEIGSDLYDLHNNGQLDLKTLEQDKLDIYAWFLEATSD
ncbi:MAG: hypothetical protein KDD48_06070 [Bdellovibrionales bacterium]|nr:hypothetical protein [Bdellovibrionales bacterium]